MSQDTKHTAITAGIAWGFAVFAFTIMALYFGGFGTPLLSTITSIYPGYEMSLTGAFIGFGYGFLSGVVAIYFVSWLHSMTRQCLSPRS